MPRYEKTNVAALEVGLSASYLYRNWRRIPAARRAGRALRWDMDELRKWMATGARRLETEQSRAEDQLPGSTTASPIHQDKGDHENR